MPELPASGCWAVIAGGGTGGHAVPAIAIGQALVERGHPAGSIRYVGARRGVEATLVPAAGFEVVLLPGRGIARRLSLANLSAVAGLVTAVLRAVHLLGRLRPSVVVVVGGFASFAAAFAAILRRVPIVVAEQNAVPGLANRLAGRFAKVCAVSFDGTPLPRSVTTGNPVRREVVEADRTPSGRAAARRELGLPEGRTVVLVVGGSLGARRINLAAAELARKWAERDDVAIRHVVGRRDWTEMSAGGRQPGRLVYEIVEFEDRMPLALAAADVVVGRAGASTVAELAVMGLPSVLVPLPGAPGDHQTHNARRLEEAGAAILIADADLTAERLSSALEPLIGDADLRERMSNAAAQLGRPGAAEAVAELVEVNARS